MRKFEVAGRIITQDGPPLVIAEAGNNHGGSLERAKEMVELARTAGADLVKFQRRNNRLLFTKEMYDSPYVSENSYGDTYGEHRDALELNDQEFYDLRSFANMRGIPLFFTPFEEESLEYLVKNNYPAIKIASGDAKNIPFIKLAAASGLPMILSTGGCTLEDVLRMHDAIRNYHANFCILQCTAAYPAEARDMHLRVIETYMKAMPDIVIGLSDHYNGIALGPAAYAVGARVFEKHFTYSHVAKGTDHAFSLEFNGLRRFVRDLQRTREALGSELKRPLEVEEKPLYKMGKGLYYADNFHPGHVLRNADILIKSPVSEFPPHRLVEVVDRELKEQVHKEDPIRGEDLA